MAELLLYVTDEQPPPERPQDGDVVCAFTDRHILIVHAQHICHPRSAPRTRDGLIMAGSLTDNYLLATKQYRFARVSAREVLRTDLATTETTLIGATPNENGEYMDVPLYLARRRRNAACPIFGAPGAEFWYGGRSDRDAAVTQSIWDMIEAGSNHNRVDYRRWPLGAAEVRRFLPIALSDDIAEDVAAAWQAAEIDETDPDAPVLTRKRAHAVVWRSDLGLSAQQRSQALNRGQLFDARELAAHAASIVRRKR